MYNQPPYNPYPYTQNLYQSHPPPYYMPNQYDLYLRQQQYQQQLYTQELMRRQQLIV